MLPLLALAQAGTTAVTKPDGYVACFTKVWLTDIIAFSNANDASSAQAYLDTKKCIPLAGGVKVTIISVDGSQVQFAFRGEKLWTVRSALTK